MNFSTISSSCRALENWERVVCKIKSVAKGSTVAGARLIQDKHWKETLKMELRVNEISLLGFVYPSSFPKEIIQEFNSIEDQKVTFNTFIQGKIDHWIARGKTRKAAQFIYSLQIVHYFSDEALKVLTADFGEEGEVIMPKPHLAEWTESHTDKVPFEEFIKLNNEPMEPKPLPVNEYIFVLTTEGQFRIVFKTGDLFHSSLSRGAAVLSAGKIKIANVNGKNKIVMVNAHSGHYRPTIIEMFNIMEFLESKGVNIDEIDFDILTETVPGNEMKRRKSQYECSLFEELKSFGFNFYQYAQKKYLSKAWNLAQLVSFTEIVKNYKNHL